MVTEQCVIDLAAYNSTYLVFSLKFKGQSTFFLFLNKLTFTPFKCFSPFIFVIQYILKYSLLPKPNTFP